MKKAFIRFGDKLKYFFTLTCWKQIYWHKAEAIKKFLKKKRIHLAVVGTPSSGKSFLLRDISIALGSLGGNAYDLKRAGYQYKNIGKCRPDEAGGNGGTPFYACRLSNHYGANMVHDGFEYDLDFLNIPGEAFVKYDPEEDKMSRVDAYNILRERLQQVGTKLFTVTTFVEKNTGEIKLIVEPKMTRPLTSGAIQSSASPIQEESRRMNFLSWEDILQELKDYQPVKGSDKNINGITLLKYFFEYDTDSVIRSIRDLIESKYIRDLGFDQDDFEGKGYDKAFVFLHYCALATDIVLCDRIYTAVEDNNGTEKEIKFGELAAGITQFIEKNNKEVKVYLAFRNVDFMLYQRENEYQKLNNEVLRGVDIEAKRNIIYSIFHSALLFHLDNNFQEKMKDYEFMTGLNCTKEIKREKLLDVSVDEKKFMETVADKYVDFDGGNGIIVENILDLTTHINSRLGGLGTAEAFRGLLQRTGINANNAQIVPHVYFTCTPVTSDYKMYKNDIRDDNTISTDFVRETTKGKEYFSRMNSCACFGSYQLCMDILRHHDLGQFRRGALLSILQGIKN